MPVVYLSQIHSDYHSTDVIMVSVDNLKAAVDAMNSTQRFPFLGDEVIFSRWENGEEVATYTEQGTRIGENYGEDENDVRPILLSDVETGLSKPTL